MSVLHRMAGAFCLAVAILAVWGGHGGLAQEVEPAAEEARQKQVMERFLGVLEKNPRRGTALDRVYGYHVEWGSLDKFLTSLRDRTKKDPKDGNARMILGLIEAQRGEDAAAVEALKQAEAHLPKNAMASYYLGQALVLVGQPEQAVEAFERAIARKPAQADLLEIFQQLGRVHQRAQRTDKALEAWNRLEKLFPNDARVQEQIAVTLVEEGQPALALPRYETLVKITKDDYRKTTYRIEAAELKVKLGKSDAGIADLEQLLSGLNPESWLHREVRRRIEEVFLRTDDQDGLVKYYERWIGKHKDDVDSMARLARVLARAARVPEASQWLDKALKLAPTRKELRLAFIEQLVDDQRFAEAAKQYEALDKVDPNNPDYIREWGKLVLKDKSRKVEERKAAAEKVWRRLAIAKPKDPLIATQVADLFRQAEMKDQALELYTKSVQLAPDDPEYREYLGEYYHLLKQPENALKTWKDIATGKRRTAENVARLAEVYNGFGYTKEAVAEIAAACKLDPKDFSLQLKAADYHARAEKHEEALTFVAAAEKLAASDDEREEILLQRIKVFQSKLSLDEEIDKLAVAAKVKDAPAATWFLLGRYYEANRQYPEASAAIGEALKKDGQSIPALAAAARIEEQGGNLGAAADLNRRLANVDRRARTDYLTTVSRLESQLGRKAEALQAARDVIAAAPGNTEHYEFFAQLCFRLGSPEEGLETLRRAMRINPTEPKLGLTLANSLAEQLRTDESIQVYWQTFEKLTELEDKLSIVQKLTELHTQLGQFDKLVERLERDRRENDKRREMTICLSQAHHSSGDYGTARQELESLLSENTRDTQLLQQLSKLSEEENDMAAAVKYQEQLAKLAPGPETEFRLAQLLQKAGANEEATALLVKLTQREQDPERVLRSIDQLLTAANHETAIAITEPLLRDQPRNWELLYREGVAYAASGKSAEAVDRFRRLLDLQTPLEELGIQAANRQKQEAAKLKSSNVSGRRIRPRQQDTVFTHLADSYRILYAVGLQSEDYYGGQQQTIWMPQMYIAARTAAWGWQLAMAQKDGKADEFVAGRKKTIDDPKASERALVDWLCLSTLRQDGPEVFSAARRLAREGTLAARQYYLQAVAGRTNNPNLQQYSNDSNDPNQDNTPPLPDEDIALLLDCYRTVTMPGNSQSSEYSLYYVQTVAKELRRAKRGADADKMISEAIEKATEPAQLSGAMSLAAEKGDLAQVQTLFDRWQKAWLALPQQQRGQLQYYDSPGQFLRQMMGLKGADKSHADVLKLYDQYMAYAVAEANLRRSQTGRRSRSQVNQYYGYGYNYYYGKEQLSTQIDYPSPSEYCDYNVLLVLRNAFEIFLRNDVESDLIAHVKKRAEESPPGEALYNRLALGYVLWWSDDRENALAELKAASELVPQDLSMRLEFASLQEAQGNFDEALAMVDAISPTDQAALQRRETMALQLAERLGDVDRARLAAERLFGLRLDSDTQLVLAQRMRRLGMDKLSEAVTARAQRQAGNRTSALLTLMTHHQGLGRTDLAIQLAHTILRRSSPSATPRNTRFRTSGSDDGSRTQALALLAQTGTLQEMIARVEAQVKSSAEPSGLYSTLAEYYTAMGDRDKSLELQSRIIGIRPEDVHLRLSYAQLLEQAGKAEEACDQYVLVLKKKPDLVANNFYQLNQTFQRANKTADLAAALDQMDLKAFRSPWYIVDLAGDMLSRKETRDSGLKLFKKAFHAYPQYRQYLINRLYNDELWQIPEVYEIAKQGLLPPEGLASIQPWFGLHEIYSYSGDGKVNTSVGKVLDGATKQNKFDDLRKDLQASVARHPGWTAGKVILALVDFRQGKKDAAKAALLEVVNNEQLLKSMNSQTRWIVGQELENFGDMQEVVIRLYEGAFESGQRNNNDFQYSPGMRLVSLYAASGRKDDARKLLLKAAAQKYEDRWNPDYNAYRRINSGITVSDQLVKLEFPLDALKIYRALLSDPNALAVAGRYYGNQPDYLASQVRTKLAELLQSLSAEKAAAVVLELLKSPDRPATASATAEEPPAVDLMLAAPARELTKSQLQSAFTTLLREVTKTAGTEEPLREAVVGLAGSHPEDFSAQITALLVLKQAGRMDDFDARLPALLALIEKSPLEDVPEGKRPNSRQRNEALKQVPVWLVAREILTDDKRREAGLKLADRALLAARRQVDTMYAASILHEWGQVALQAGDRAEAEARWAALLELVTERPKPKKGKAEQPPQPTGMRGEGRGERGERRQATGDRHQGVALREPSVAPNDPSGLVRGLLPRLRGRRWPIGRMRGGEEQGRLLVHGELRGELDFVKDVSETAESQRAPSPGLLATLSPEAGERGFIEAVRAIGAIRSTLILVAAAQAEAAAPPKPAPAPPADRVPPITVSQFTLAVQLAKLAAENDMPNLSLRSVKQALAGGAPLPDLPQGEVLGSSRPRAAVVQPALNAGSSDESLGTVASALRELSSVWEVRNFPPHEVYDLLRPIVFSEERPTEILVYPEGVSTSSGPQSSLGVTLVAWAIRAKKTDDLQKAIADRSQSPTARLAGLVLTVQLALQSRDTPKAKAGLQALAVHLKTDQVQASVELACHAALPAFENEELADSAFGIVETAARQFSTQGRDDAGELFRRLTRHLGQKGDAAGARKQLETYLGSQQGRYTRYGGDYALYLQRQDLATAALESARSGLTDLALEYLGRYSDAPPYRYSDVGIERPLYLVARILTKMPPAERYALLREWTMPADKRKTVRLMAGWTESISVPAIFLESKLKMEDVSARNSEAVPGASLNSDYLSNFDLLIHAATEAGKLDELTAEAKKAVAEKVLRADLFLATLLSRRGDQAAAKPVVDALLAGFDKRNEQDNRTERGISMWAEYLVCRSLLESPATIDLAMPFAEKLRHLTQQHQKWDFMTHLRYDMARARLAQAKGSLKPGLDPDVNLWTASTPFGHILHYTPAWWVLHEGQLTHIGGSGHDMLYFDWPLTGDFEFSADAYNGSWGEADVGYGGIVVEAQHRGNQTQIWPVGQHEQISRGEPMEKEDEGFNRITLQVSQGKLRYLLNGYLVYEETASPTSPWLTLFAHFPRFTSFKNLSLTGKPVIPREVRLTDGNHLEGWMCGFGNTQPSRRLAAEKPDPNNDAYQQQQQQHQQQVFDWDAKDGEIIGYAMPAAGSKEQAWLSYHRPMQPGDKIRYEFQFEPGKKHIHPTLGRLAFVLDPAGVKLHWLSQGAWEDDVLRLAVRNEVVDPEIRRGPPELPLKQNEWNTVELSLKKGEGGIMVSLALNGQIVVERPVEKENDRRFGFFRYRNETSSLVRNIVLTGDWPDSPEADLLADGQVFKGPNDDLARHAVLGDQFAVKDALDVWKRGMALPAEPRYDHLKNWVLPGDDHPTYRLMVASVPIGVDMGTLLPRDRVKGAGAGGSDALVAASRTGLAEGAVVAPVFSLIDTAVELNKLDELQQAVDAAPSSTSVERRNRLALQAMLAMAAGQLPVADAHLRELFVLAQPLLPHTLPLHERMPEYAAAWRCAQNPALARVAFDIAQLLVDKHQANGGGAEWDRMVRELRTWTTWHLDSETADKPFGTLAPGLSQWVVSPYLTARQRGEGFRPCGWRYTRGSVEHVPGHSTTRLIFNTPLRGDFEITGQRSTFGWRETYVCAAGIGVDPLYNQQGYWIRRWHRDFQKPDIPLSLPGWNHFMDFKIAVKWGVMTVSANGVNVHVEPLPLNRDPWVVIESSQVGNLGCVRNLRIEGTPEIPEVLNLSELDHLAGWRADMYGDSVGDGDNVTWRRQGEEIVGAERKDRVGAFRESLLSYHRPVLEDGEIEYEFLYLPGKQEVHPCVGRSAVLLRIDGAKLHRLTCAQYEPLGLACDNQEALPGAASAVPLKENEWNAVKLTFRGDQVTVSVNGTDVAQVPCPADASRLFGLFRYSDQTGCRVRKIRYRGNWPKQLVGVGEQELAYAPGGYLPPAAAGLETAVVKLGEPTEKLAAMGWRPTGKPQHMSSGAKGLHLALPAGEKEKWTAGLIADRTISGDFDVSLAFENLKLVAPKEGHAIGLDFSLNLSDPNNTRIALNRRIEPGGKSVLHAACAHKLPDGRDHYQVWTKETDFSEGVLRIVRRGGRAYYLYSAGPKLEFQLLQALDIGTADANAVLAVGTTGDAASGIDVILKELTLKTQPPAAAPPPK